MSMLSSTIDQHWTVDVLDDGARHVDEGREVQIRFTNRASGRRLEGTVIYYAGDRDAVVAQLSRDDLSLPEHTARRLLAKLCVRFMRSVGRHGDCGLTASVVLDDIMSDMYVDGTEVHAVLTLIDSSLRTFGQFDEVVGDRHGT